MFGAYSAIVLTTVSPNASRCSSQLPLGEMVGRVLHEARHHVLARRRDRRIGQARDDDVDVRAAARTGRTSRRRTRAPCSRCPARSKSRRAGGGPAPGRQREVRQPIEREVHLAGRAAELVAPHVLDELGRQLRFVDQPRERQARIEARRHEVARRGRRRSSSTTPRARSLTLIFATAALVRISTPASRAAAAIALEIAPVPPRARPHDRNAPSISPM